jgi:hypothetical protein
LPYPEVINEVGRVRDEPPPHVLINDESRLSMGSDMVRSERDMLHTLEDG